MNSEFRRLFLLVEGADDSLFCQEVLYREFQTTFHHVQTWEYSQRTPSELVDLLRSIRAMNADYILFADIDEHPCVTATKEAVENRFSGLDWGQIVVVRREIEAWYLAGLSASATLELGIDRVLEVDAVTKERFDQLVGGRRQHQTAMDEILRYYDVEVARQRSPSFRYFWQKHVE